MSKLYGRPPFKAFKAFDRDLSCLNFLFKEGETYEIPGVPILCRRGFHFCKDLILTLEYYPISKCITENKYAEVEILGEYVFEKPTMHKGVTNILKIVRVFSDEEIIEYIKNTNNTYNNGKHNSGAYNSGDSNSGDFNSGNHNNGNGNSGDFNSGCHNSGNFNSGNYNYGRRNSGSYNSGYHNSGWCNSGDYNSGSNNSGHYNSGNYNDGCHNSGDHNNGSYNNGYFNTIRPEEILVFNRPCNLIEWFAAEKPCFLINIKNMKGDTYKERCLRAWEKASLNDRKLTKALPNFDADVFFKITGIDVNK